MKNTKDRFPLDPKVNWWRLPEEVAVLAKKVNDIEAGGVAGSPQDLQEVTDEGESTTNNIQFLDNGKILFDNGSRLQKGTTNAYYGGNGGISQVCSIDYELKWEAGMQYVLGQDGFTIREVRHTFTLTPGANDDTTKGFVPGSRWILDNGDAYECIDSTSENATWKQVSPKYKVFTALVSQNGTPTEDSLNSGELVLGVTYRINELSVGMDFTNVGAPDNELNTTFLATGITPNSWGQGATYTLAYSEGVPVVKVLENTIGNIWLTYAEAGGYYIEAPSDLFERRKTWCSINPADITGPSLQSMVRKNDYAIVINTSFDGIASDGILDNVPVEVRIYN